MGDDVEQAGEPVRAVHRGDEFLLGSQRALAQHEDGTLRVVDRDPRILDRGGVLAEQVKTLTTRLDRVESAQAELVRELQAVKAAGASGAGAAAVDVSRLPARFTDYVDYQNERGDDEVLGVHICGPMAGELIGELVLGMEFSASAEDLQRTIHAHPTLSEAVHEAALAVDGRALHAINK